MSQKPKDNVESPVEAPKRKRDREASERALLEAAISVFSEVGFDAATTREIAHRAGVSEALIQRYFEGKNGLLLSVISSFSEGIEEELNDSLPLQNSLEAELNQSITTECAKKADKCEFIRVVLSRAILDKNIGKELGNIIYNRELPITKARLLHYQHINQLKPGEDLHSIALFMSFLGFFISFMGPEVLNMDREQLNKMGELVARVMARGLKP